MEGLKKVPNSKTDAGIKPFRTGILHCEKKLAYTRP